MGNVLFRKGVMSKVTRSVDENVPGSGVSSRISSASPSKGEALCKVGIFSVGSENVKDGKLQVSVEAGLYNESL